MTEQIVIAVVVRGDEFLLCHRVPTRRWYPDVWDLPGGHVEEGEEPAAALVRELHEELDIRVDEGMEPLVGVSFDNVDALVWVITNWAGEVRNAAPDEHDEIGWFRAGDLDGLEMADPQIVRLCELALNA